MITKSVNYKHLYGAFSIAYLYMV